MSAAESRAPVVVNPVLRHPRERRQGLDGTWSFRLDPGDVGVREAWFRQAPLIGEPIAVPGCWQGQGFGGDGLEMVWDFRLSARLLRATYTGTGWYGRTIRLPSEWRGERSWLAFGGVHPTAEVWLDGSPVGEHHEPFVPFALDVTGPLADGGEHFLAVRVSEADRIMGFAFNFQGTWSGLYRGVDLLATGPAYLRDLRADPDPVSGTVRVHADIGGTPADGSRLTLELSLSTPDGTRAAAGTFTVAAGQAEAVLEVARPRAWSPDDPFLYRLDAVLTAAGRTLDARSDRIGFVALSTEGKRITVNGVPWYFRGTGEFLSNPETGSPDTDRDRWRRKLRVLRDYGYTYVRCQSFVPAPEYFDAADEVGLLVQSEMGTLGAWGGSDAWHGYAWPQPTPGMRERLVGQWDRVVIRDANHPSAQIYCMSNELGQQTDYPRLAWQCYRQTKRVRPRSLVIWTDGGCSAELPGDFVNDEAALDAKTPLPVVQHEFRWWSSYPDVRTMDAFDGALRPYGAEIALAAAARHGIARVLPRAAETSQRLQYLEARGKMERCRRDNPTLAGICHFNAMDGQLSPQGIVDEHYGRKYADAALWQRTNGDTVVLASLDFADRVRSGGETLSVALSVSDWSRPALVNPLCRWRLEVEGAAAGSGDLAFEHRPYRTCPIGEVRAVLPTVDRPKRAALVATVTDGARSFTNSWDLWLFPAAATSTGPCTVYGAPRHTWLRNLAGAVRIDAAGLGRVRKPGPVLTEVVDDALAAWMQRGGRAILAASEGLVRPFRPKFGYKEGHYFFTPPANYPPYEDGHDGTIVADHPMLDGFPHEGFADLQFFRMMADSPPLELEPLGLTGVDPVIRVMHSFPVARPLGYLAEARVGEGGLVLTALGLDQDLPEARYLFAVIHAYAGGQAFAPALRLADAALEAIARATVVD
jgi:beta-galactosidase